MESRMHAAICLGPTGSLQGTYKFFSLLTGRQLRQLVFPPCPMPDSLITTVEELSTADNLPGDFNFADCQGVLFEWNDKSLETSEPLLDHRPTYPAIPAKLPGVALGHDKGLMPIEPKIIPQGQAETTAALKIKGRACADGRKQRYIYSKDNTTSPMVAMESVMLMAVIEVYEEQEVACYDIPGTFLHANLDEDVVMVLKGWLAELMVQVAPNLYRKLYHSQRMWEANRVR